MRFVTSRFPGFVTPLSLSFRDILRAKFSFSFLLLSFPSPSFSRYFSVFFLFFRHAWNAITRVADLDVARVRSTRLDGIQISKTKCEAFERAACSAVGKTTRVVVEFEKIIAHSLYLLVSFYDRCIISVHYCRFITAVIKKFCGQIFLSRRCILVVVYFGVVILFRRL